MSARTFVIAGAAALAGCGMLGMAPAAAQASSASVPAWTEQAPAVHPPARKDASMAYDAATGTVVLFGGRLRNDRPLGDTWTWDGTTWTEQHPAISPPVRGLASMAYDAATGTVLLFGGVRSGRLLGDTWTWDGTNWTKQHPATHPPARLGASMAYDAATGTAVLFGGLGRVRGGNTLFADTWTWDGTNWTKEHPATSPPAREEASMAYDAANGTAVLFGGNASSGNLGDTWTWAGSNWTRQHPATQPSARDEAAMAYDAATGTAVLFGGSVTGTAISSAGTWTWAGTNWTRQHPAAHPRHRAGASMAYDAATGTAVLFGGYCNSNFDLLHDTWTWG